jgi:ACR3 family arsenite transporter
VSTSAADPAAVRLRTLDRLLPLWILLAVALGLLVGRLAPGVAPALDAAQVSGVSLPIAIGLFLMMYPVLARVRYADLGRLRQRGRLFGVSLVLNWVVGPLLMFALAWVFLPDLPEYRTGLILIGLARCIAMVLIWNMLARGNAEVAAVLVALNSLFQIVFYSAMGWFFLTVVPGWFGGAGTALNIGVWDIARNVLVFLGLPLLAAVLTRTVCERYRGRAWYEQRVLPRIGPLALLALLYTIVVMFALQGDRISRLPLDVVRIAVPLLAYFAVMFTASFLLSWKLGFSYEETASLSFTAAGNNFELAIAVAVATFGLSSGEALAGVVGPLIEVPALVTLVYLSLWLRSRLFGEARLFAPHARPQES